jgi:hypothetical protein
MTHIQRPEEWHTFCGTLCVYCQVLTIKPLDPEVQVFWLPWRTKKYGFTSAKQIPFFKPVTALLQMTCDLKYKLINAWGEERKFVTLFY